MHLGEKLKLYRKRKSLDQPQMAKIVGVSYRSYQEIERTGIVKKSDVLANVNRVLADKEQIPARNETQESASKSVDIGVAEYIAELKQQKEFLQALLMKNAEDVGTNLKGVNSDLAEVRKTVDGTWAKVSAAIDVSLKALARLEKRPEESLLDEKDNVLRHNFLQP